MVRGSVRPRRERERTPLDRDLPRRLLHSGERFAGGTILSHAGPLLSDSHLLQ